MGFAGAVGCWLTIKFRGEIWLYFAPVGAVYYDHIGWAPFRGFLIGGAAGGLWLIADAVVDYRRRRDHAPDG